MWGYLFKRSVLTVITIWLITVFTFFFTQILPGDTALLIAGQDATEAQLDAIRADLGLDRPLIVQYFDWFTSLLQGDMGTSYTFDEPVTAMVLNRLPQTLYLGLLGMLVAILTAVPLGVIASRHHNDWIDFFISGTVLLGISVPSFFWALVFILLFSTWMGILPPTGYVSPTEDLVGFLRHAAMPAAALGWGTLAHVTRMLRSSLIEEMQAKYVDTALAKGLSTRSIIYGHSLRNALLPTITIIGIQIGAAANGVVILEEVFAWPGLGRLAFNAIEGRDIPVVQATIIVIALIYIVANFVIDMLYMYLDPRIRLGGQDQ